MKSIVLDSTPLGLLTQRPDATEAEACKNWLKEQITQGVAVLVPEIVDYELRRELIRSGKFASVRRLDQFIAHQAVTFLPLTTDAMRLAADMWAKARNQGTPTASPKSLDIDVILAAQVLTAGFAPADFVVATSNVSHLSLFVPAELWPNV